MKVLFLDIDGVLNDHTASPSGYCIIQDDKVELLNQILDYDYRIMLVISSAWRYMILNDSMNLDGFTNLLLSHGINCYNRVIDCLRRDIDIMEYGGRADLIRDYLLDTETQEYVVVDDLPLKIDNLVQTNGTIGLTQQDVNEIIRIFNDYNSLS